MRTWSTAPTKSTCKLTDKREFKAKVIGADKRTDVALIKIDASEPAGGARSAIPNRLKVGEWVVAIGSPFGFENTVTAGIVSAKGRSLPQENFVPFIQTDVAINPGNSGGPLFNMRGEVVGINSQIYSRTGGFMGLSFAIPIDVALDVQHQLRDKGRVTRGRIGVVIQEVTKDLAAVLRPRPSRTARWSTRWRRAARRTRRASRRATSSRGSTARTSTARAICRASSARRGPGRRSSSTSGARAPRARCR